MTRTSKWILFGVLLLAAIAALFFGKRLFSHGDSERYVTAPASRADIEQVVSASGTLNPVTVVNVGTQISGIVRALNVDFNDKVQKGQVLAELDQSLLRAALEQSQGNLANAQASLKLARLNFARQEQLLAANYIARADFDAARQQLETAQAQVKTASGQVARDQVNISYSIIRSPVAGVVIARQVDLGQTVAASFQTPTLFQIAEDLRKMKIDTNLSEADVGAVREGMPARFTVDAFPGREFEGSVRQIRLNPTSVQNVVTYDVVIDVDNPDLSLLPGMTAFVTLIQAEHENALRVPNAALTFRPAGQKPDYARLRRQVGKKAEDDRQTVYVLKGSEPAPMKVKAGISDGKYTEILDGDLREGMPVVTDDLAPPKKSSGPSLFPGAGAPVGGGRAGGRTPRF